MVVVIVVRLGVNIGFLVLSGMCLIIIWLCFSGSVRLF